MAESIQTIIVGGGQAGLSVSYYLSRQGRDPDGFMSREEVVTYLEKYVERFHLPVRYCARVTKVEQNSRCNSYCITTNRGTSAQARNVVIATGLYQQPKIPSFSADLPSDIKQLHSDTYR